MRPILILALLLCCVSGSDASRRRDLLMQQEVAAGGGVDNTLILRYKFDEGSGTAALDETSNNNDATLTGGVTWITGKSGSGGAVRFDGSNDYLKSDASVTYGASILTVCFWAKVPTWPSGAGTYNLFESSANYIVQNNAFRAYADFAVLQTYISGDAFTTMHEDDTPDPTDATWVHLTFILDNSTTAGDIEVYYDGVLQTEDTEPTTKTGSGNFTAQILNIASRDGGSMFANIDIDDFCIFSGALLQTEIEYVRDNPDR